MKYILDENSVSVGIPRQPETDDAGLLMQMVIPNGDIKDK